MRSLLVSSFLFFTLSVAAEPLSSLPDHASQNWWSAVQHSIRASEYEPKLHEGVPGAPNRAHGFRTRFEADRVVVVPRDGSRAWRWEIGLADAPAAEPHANENRVEYRRGDVVEWYVNSEKGLEQGFTIASPATKYVAGATLRLPLLVGGSLQAQARDGQRIDFFTSAGALAIRYDSLLVVDARGRTLRSRMELHGSQLHLLADVEGASWPIVVDPLTTSPAWSAESDQVGAQLGMSVASSGDVNGDGYSDVIVGAPFYDLGQIDGGCAFVYHGSPAGLSATANWTASSNQSGSDFGISVASAGDVNGDGYSDVIVGADLYSNGENMEGRAFVYYGSSSGLSLTPVWTAEGDQEFATFGYAVASAGDVNGDGYHDVVVGAYTYQNGQPMEGRAFVYHGSSSGLSGSPEWMAESDQGASYFGYSVARAGDVNGDGYDDLIVSAPNYSNGQAGEGRVSVYHGSAAGLAAEPEWTTESDRANAFFGVSVATAGDVNGDGYADVIVGAHAYSNLAGQEGGAFLYLGSSTGLSATAGWMAEGGQTGANFGVQVGSAGDVNADGYADVIVGAHNFDAGQTDEGRAFLYYGSATGLPAIANWTAESDQASAYFALSVATAGDVNGDGYSDVIVGAYSWDGGETNEGRAFVYHGSAAGLATTAAWTAESDQTGAAFGTSVAPGGDVNGDGYADVIVGAQDYNNGTTRGRVFVYHGSASGLLTAAAWTAESDQANALFAHSVASAGDVNGDGYSDVIVGAAQYSNGQSYEGRALVYHGSATGLSVAPAWSIEGNEVGAGLGYSVASAGDVNGDGFADVIVGAPAFFGVSGRAFVYHGSAAGLSSTAAWTGECDQPRSEFGVAVAPAGDVNGDGYSDVIVGADYYSNGQTYEGRAFVYHGSVSGLSAIVAWTAEGDQANAGFGISVAAAGDVNGDGYGDVIVGADGYGDTEAAEGRAFVYQGSAAGLSGTAAWTAESNQADAWYGGAVASAGDVNGDGYSDVVVGSGGYDNGQTDEGRAFVYHGAAAGLAAVAAWTAESDQAYGYFGQSAAPAGDVNGDGYADVIIGAVAYDNGAVDEGRTFVYYGNEGAGRSLATQQLRGDGSRPAQEWGLSHHGTSFIVALNASSPWGRDRAKVQAEACPASIDFGNAGCSTFTSTSWTDLGADGVARLQLPVTGLTSGTLYHWRVRALFAPYSVTAAGITAPPAPRHTPWRRLDAQEDNADVRVGAQQAVTVGLQSATMTVPEAGPNAGMQIVVTTSNGLPTVVPTSVAYTTTNGTAIAGSDYTATAGTLDIPAATVSGSILTVNVPVTPDTMDEAHEVFAFTISEPDGASLGPITTTTVTITDDDAPPTFSVGDVTLAEGNSGTTAFTFTITKSGSTSLYATVDVATADGTATVAGSDYAPVALNTLSFAPAEATQTVIVSVAGDMAFESSETFFVNLTNVTNATLVDSQGLGTITNDDLAPALSIDDITHVEGNGGATNFVFTVTLAGATQQTVTVSVITLDGTAIAGSDYTHTVSELTFEPGTMAQTITVPVIGDTVTEDDETFAVHLVDETNATIDEDTATGTIQNDDALPTLSIDSVTQAEGHDGPTDFVFTVTLTGATEQTVMVSWATSGNTATPGVDYTTASGMLTFAPGETTQPITIAVTGEGVVENDETFTVTLSAPVHAVIAIGACTGTIVNDDASPFGPPELFSAASTSASTVRLSWAPVYGSTGYEIYRSTSLPAGFALLTATTATTHTDSGLVANTTYLYKVRAVSGWVTSAFCEADAATTTVFTDPTLSSAIKIKAVHLAQLRIAVNAMRTTAGLPVAVFTDPTLTPGTTLVKGAHITELRTALDGARTAIGLPSLTYTDGALFSGKTLVKAVHVNELREGTQ